MKTFMMLFLTLILLCSCVTTTTTVGVLSCLHNTGHESTANNTYALGEIAERSETGWEFNMGVVLYKVDDEMFNDFNFGIKKWFTKKWKWSYVEAGIGAKLSEMDDRNPWLAGSALLADVSCGFGIQGGGWSIGYKFQHLSTPWRDDYGLNFDALIIKCEF